MSESIPNATEYVDKREGDLSLPASQENIENSVHTDAEKKGYTLYSVYGKISFINTESLTNILFPDEFFPKNRNKIEDFNFYELSPDATSKLTLQYSMYNYISSEAETIIENAKLHLEQLSKINLKEQKIIKFEEIRPESVIVFEFKHLVVKRENRIEIRHETSIEELKRDALADSLYYNRRAIKRNLNGQFLCMMYITKKLKISQRLTRY